MCRLLPDQLEARQGGWLSSVFNAGQGLSIEAFAHTRLELTVHQEPHVTRGESSFALLLDLGLAVLKQSSDGPDGAGGGEWKLVAEAERTLKPSGCLQVTLEQDAFTTRYLVLPLCFAQMKSTEPRKFVISAHSDRTPHDTYRANTTLPATDRHKAEQRREGPATDDRNRPSCLRPSALPAHPSPLARRPSWEQSRSRSSRWR